MRTAELAWIQARAARPGRELGSPRQAAPGAGTAVPSVGPRRPLSLPSASQSTSGGISHSRPYWEGPSSLRAASTVMSSPGTPFPSLIPGARTPGEMQAGNILWERQGEGSRSHPNLLLQVFDRPELIPEAAPAPSQEERTLGSPSASTRPGSWTGSSRSSSSSQCQGFVWDKINK